MRAATAWNCWRRKRWRRRRESTSARTAPNATYASPTRARWRTSRRPRAASDALRLLRLLPENLEAGALGEHLVRVLRARLVESAGVHLQRGLRVAEAPLVLAQDLGADLDVDLGHEQHVLAAMVYQFVEVVLRNDLHQALGAGHDLGDRHVAPLHRHDRDDQ